MAEPDEGPTSAEPTAVPVQVPVLGGPAHGRRVEYWFPVQVEVRGAPGPPDVAAVADAALARLADGLRGA